MSTQAASTRPMNRPTSDVQNRPAMQEAQTRPMPIMNDGRRNDMQAPGTETKQAFKTTEFWVYIGLLLALLIAGAVADNDSEAVGGEGSGFGAEDVWLYATLLTIGYLISRGLAKAGSRDPYWDRPDTGSEGEGFGERVRAAAQVIKEGPDAVHGSDHRSEAETRQY